MLRLSILKGASQLAVSQLLIAVCSFLRNIIIARQIGTDDYGIASTFALTVSLVEMTSNLALDRALVQDEKGGTPEMLASAHTLQFIKGLITAVLLFLLAKPLALLFGLPEIAWAYQLLAAIPLIHGLSHFGIVVRQRKMEFAATAINDALPQVTSLIVAASAALLVDDYRLMLLVLFVNSGLHALISHLLARVPYHWAWRRDLVARQLRFGWPLLVNGLLMFGIFQGDRVIIGATFDMHTLGWYSAGFSLCMLPTLIFARLCGYLLTPILSRGSHDQPAYRNHCSIALVSCFCFALLVVSFFAIAGGSMVYVSFGSDYVQVVEVIFLLALMQGLRIARIAPSIIANSQARTTNGMIANLFRSAVLPLALLVAVAGMGVKWIALCGVFGELLALSVSVYLLRLGDFKMQFVRQVTHLGTVFLVTCILLGIFVHPQPGEELLDNVLLLAAGAAIALLLATMLALSQQIVRQEMSPWIKNFLRSRSKHSGSQQGDSHV